MALGVSAYAVADAVNGGNAPRSREEIAKLRAERPRKARSEQAAAPAKVHAGDKQLYAFHVSAYDCDLENWCGVVKVVAGANAPEVVKELSGSDPIFHAVYMGDKALVVRYGFDEDGFPTGDYFTFEVYNTETWAKETSFTKPNNIANLLPYSMAYDHTTQIVYGSFFANPSSPAFTEDASFGYIDVSNTEKPVTILNSELPERMRAMTVDKEGTVYGLSFTGKLYTINKYSGVATATGVTVNLPTQDDGDPSATFNTHGHESMCCDWESGKFYVTYGDDFFNSYVACFDPLTGEAEMLADYSYSDYGSETCDVLTGLFFEQKTAAAVKGTPEAVADFAAEAVGTELKANVTFTMPAVDTDGNALDTDLTWSVGNGVSEFAAGTAHSGTKVEAAVEVPASGRTALYVTTANGESVSNPASASVFVGCDVPVINGLPALRVNGQQVTVSWNEAVAADGGNLDPVTYKLTRQPDNVVVAEAHDTNSFVDQLTSDIKTQYYYEIQPKAGTVEGEAVTSRKAYAGKYISMPLNEDFSDEAMFLEYPIIDANNDDNCWEWVSRTNYSMAVYPATSEAADDYLLIGPFKMEAGTTYMFHMLAGGHSIREDIALYVGTNPNDVNSFSTQLVAPTSLIASQGDKNFDVAFEPETSGDYYFGIHACTPFGSKFIYLYEVSVKALGGDAPAAPDNFDIVPQAESAIINFTLPTKSISGSTLESLTQALVYRDNVLIATLTDGVAPGAEMSYTDTEEVSKGFHTYSVASVSPEGEGKYVSAQVWRGADCPGRPSNLRIWEDLNTPGLMHATFDAPTRGYYGGYINPDEITYLIDWLVMGGGSGVIELGQGTEHTFQLPIAITQQDIFGGSVYGRNSQGSVAGYTNWITSTAYFGPAMQLPVHDSWSGVTNSGGAWSGQDIDDDAGLSETYWGSVTSPSQDMDGGLMAMTTTVDNGGKRLLSPRVTIEGAENPALVFYYRYTAQVTMFNLEIMVDDQPFTQLQELDLAPANVGKWIRMEVPLDAYKDSKRLQFGFAARGNIGENIACIDNVTVSDLKANDLSILKFSAPDKVNANGEAKFSILVRNTGNTAVAANDYTVKLYKNGEQIASVAGKALGIDSETYLYASDYPTVADPENCVYYAEIDYAADQNADNNVSSSVSVRVAVVEYPTVTDLKGEYNEGIALTWSDPDMSQIPGVSTTETFESYEAFILDNIGAWTVHDGDGKNTVKMATTLGVLDYPHIGEPMAWQVFDPSTANVWGNAWYARSGSKILASFQAVEPGNSNIVSDDWLISPELNASEQVISFYSHAGMSGQYTPEVFDFMVSDKTNAIADFTVLAADVEVAYTSDTWVEYTFRVPTGTRYFAIVHKSVGKLAMLVDDITYIPAGSAPVQLDLMGFNVYRDGKRITSEPIGDNAYTDTDVEEGQEYTYCVSAVWDKGESHLSDPVTISATSSIDNATTYDITIQGGVGFIRISGGIGEQAEVYNMAGALVASVKAEGTVDVPVAKGVYVVRAGGAAAKVAVR